MEKSKIETVLLPVNVQQQQSREERIREEFWPKFRTFAARLPFAEDVAAAYFCATDAKTPFKVRGTLLAALAYFIMPIDLIPDFLIFIGFTDDIAVLSAAFVLVSQHVTDEHREKARDALETEKS